MFFVGGCDDTFKAADQTKRRCRMARFIIADLADPSSIPQELQAIVPHLAKPAQPLLEGASRPYAMFRDYRMYDWVLPVHRYEGLDPLLATLAEKVIAPAEEKVKDLRRRMIEAELTKPSHQEGDRLKDRERDHAGDKQ
jgi:hypothetical protein